MRYVILGGGIAGVCCALELARCLQQHGTSSPTRADEPNPTRIDEDASNDQIILVSSSSVLKGVREVARLTRLVEELEVNGPKPPALSFITPGPDAAPYAHGIPNFRKLPHILR